MGAGDRPLDVLDDVVDRLFDGTLALDVAVENIQALLESVDDALVVYDALRRLGERLAAAGNPNRVVDLAVLFVEVARLCGRRYEGAAQLMVGEKLASLDEPQEAILHLEEAARLLTDAPPYALLARCRKAACLLRLNNPQDAATQAGTAVTAIRELEHTALLAVALLVHARALGRLGQHGTALGSVREAAELRQRLDQGEVVEWQAEPLGAYYQVLGEEARFAGQYEEALEAFEEGRAAAMAAGNAYAAAWMLSEIGYTWEIAGERERGAALLGKAAAEAEALGDTDSATRWGKARDWVSSDDESTHTKLSRAVAIAETQPERLDEAVRLAREAVAEAKRQGNRVLEGQARNALGSLLEMKGQSILAINALRVAVAIAQETGDLGAEFHYRANLAMSFGQRARLEDGEAELRHAIACGERLRREADSAELRQAVAAGLARAYEQLAFFASVSYRPGKYMAADPQWRPPQPLPMLEVGQRLRAHNLLRWIRLGQLVERGDETLVEPMLALRAADVRIEMAAQDGATDLGERIRRREECEARFLAAAGVAGIPAEDADPPLYSLADLEAALEPGELIVDLLALLEGITMTCIGGGGPPSTTLIGSGSRREDRMKLVRSWKRALKRAAHLDLDPESPKEDARYRRFSAELNELVFREIVEVIGERGQTPQRLFVVPHAELFQVPFWRLTEQLPGVVVSVLPTSAALVLLRQRQRTDDEARVAIGDASGTLPYSERELAWLPRYQPCPPEAEALLGRLPRADRLHFSGHGIFDANNPYRSGLELAPTSRSRPDPLAAPQADGQGELFTVAQIVGRLHLPACHLAVLSGCDTGLPRAHSANEFTSLPAALLIAGARNVIASIWPAQDPATALLMRELYQVMEEGGGRPSDALAEARRRLAKLPRDEAVRHLGDDRFVPRRDVPFAASIYTDTFQHYGVD
jgi:tetratricopeptide (TPR) repeat protein